MYKLDRCHQGLPERPRQRARAAGRGRGHRGRRLAGHPGADRTRQEHPAADARRPRPAHLRPGGAGRPQPHRAARTPAHQGARGSIGFIFQTFNLIPTLSAQENVEAALVPLRDRAPTAQRAGRRRRWPRSGWPTGPGTCRPSCPAGSSSGWPSPGRWSSAPAFCSPTSPPATSTRAPGTRSSTLLARLWREHGLTLVIVTHDSSVARRARHDRPHAQRPAHRRRLRASRRGVAVPLRQSLRAKPQPGPASLSATLRVSFLAVPAPTATLEI